MRIKEELQGRLRLVSGCRLCLKITLIVCFSILVIEAAILVPSYLRLHGELYPKLADKGARALALSLRARDHHTFDEIFAKNAQALHDAGILGAALHGVAGERLATFGTIPLPDPPPRTGPFLRPMPTSGVANATSGPRRAGQIDGQAVRSGSGETTLRPR